jgi:hypothetical protein
MKRGEFIMLPGGAIPVAESPAGYVDRILRDANFLCKRIAPQPDVALKGRIKDDVSFARRSNDHSRRLRTRAYDGDARRSCTR